MYLLTSFFRQFLRIKVWKVNTQTVASFSFYNFKKRHGKVSRASEWGCLCFHTLQVFCGSSMGFYLFFSLVIIMLVCGTGLEYVPKIKIITFFKSEMPLQFLVVFPKLVWFFSVCIFFPVLDSFHI